jgi:hypothetical protein
MIGTYLKIIPPSPRGVRWSIAKGPVDLLPAERVHVVFVHPGREYRLGGGGEIRRITTLKFSAAFLTPTLSLPRQGGGNLSLRSVAQMERSAIRESAMISPGSGAARLHPGYKRDGLGCSPDGAQRNPGFVNAFPDPGAARLHPGHIGLS